MTASEYGMPIEKEFDRQSPPGNIFSFLVISNALTATSNQ